MSPLTLTPSQARRFLLAHQGLWPPRSWNGKADILAYFQRIGCIQFDPLNIIGHNSDLALQSRINAYRPRLLTELLYTDRKLIDGFDKVMSIYRLEDWPYFHRLRQVEWASMQRRSEGLQSVLPLVRAAIENRGPLCSLDLDFDHRVDWPWGPTRASRAALESLYFAGELVVHHKVNTRKYYDLARRHIPQAILQAPDPNTAEADYHDWHVLRRIGSVGLLSNRSGEAWLGLMGVKTPQRAQAIKRLLADSSLTEARVEGIADPFYLRSQDLPTLKQAIEGAAPSPRASFIAPLDNLTWDRRQVEALFGFEYRWEVYTPPAKRKYGYYVLPVLYGEHFIARIEPVLEKRTRTLVIKNWWWEKNVISDDIFLSALAECLEHFVAYLNARSIQLDGTSLDPNETGRLATILVDR